MTEMWRGTQQTLQGSMVDRIWNVLGHSYKIMFHQFFFFFCGLALVDANACLFQCLAHPKLLSLSWTLFSVEYIASENSFIQKFDFFTLSFSSHSTRVSILGFLAILNLPYMCVCVFFSCVALVLAL